MNHAVWQSKMRNTHRVQQISIVLVLLLIMSSCGASTQYTHPQGVLRDCGPTLRLDIVATERSRQQGLMGVTSLPDNYGMLFVFNDTDQPSFWMKDTIVPLEVVFMSKTGQIKAIAAMQPRNETVHTAPEPLPYALEVPQGWMATHGISVGDTCSIEIPYGLTVE
ncbi:MAG: DUF192 domain-containing protein [Roseiflexaceae bacterium]